MKKFLSLVLALVMTMSLVTVSAGAKDFADDDKVTYDEAVAVMSEVKVLDGYADGSFKPQGGLTRGAAAKIICNLILGPTTAAELHADTAPYKDVPVDHTFAGYIAYCAKEGIISGYADGAFRPSAPLTGYAFMKMLLGALGYDAEIEQYTGANWSINVAKRALNIGLNKSLEGDFNGIKHVTREEAALYAFNTLKADLVEYDSRTSVNVGGAEVVIAGSEAKAQKWNNSATKIENIKKDDYIQFAEQYFTKLVLDETTDAFGRPAREWSYKGDEIGTYVNTDLLKESYTEKVTGKELYSLLGKSVIDDYDFSIYVDGETEKNILNKFGVETYFTAGNLVKGNDKAVGDTGNGVLTEVYVDSDEKEVTIAIINTYLAKADSDYDKKRDEASFDVWGLDDAGKKQYVKRVGDYQEDMTVSGEDFDVEEIEEGKIVLVTVADGEIQTIAEPETLDTVEISAFKKNSNITVEGTKYSYADTACYDNKTLVVYTSEDDITVNLKDTNYNVVLDPYGYVIGIEEVEPEDNYVFITGYDGNYSNISSRTADMAAIFMDGSMKVIEVNVKKSDEALFDESLKHARDEDGKVKYSAGLINTWCTYTVNDDNVYTLKIAKDQYAQDVTSSDEVEINKKHISLKAGSGSKYVYGNDKTVYLDVSLDNINTMKDEFTSVIDDVESVTTGVKNTDLLVKGVTKKTVDAKKTADFYPSEEIYTLWDGGYAIAVVVIGEDQGVSSNYAYVTSSDVEQEGYDKTTKEHTWSREVVINGKLTTISYVGDSINVIDKTDMKQGEWYKVTYYADGNVKGAEALSTKLADADKKDEYVNDVEDIEEAVEEKDVVLYNQKMEASDNASLQYEDGSLYVKTTKKTGFSVSPEVKVVLCNADGKGKAFDEIDDTYDGYKGLENGVLRLPDRETLIPLTLRRELRAARERRGTDPHVLLKPRAGTPLDGSYLSRRVRTVLLKYGVDDILFRDVCRQPPKRGEKEQLVALAGEMPGFSRADAAARLELSQAALYRRLRELVGEGRLVRVGSMYYLPGTVVPEEEQMDVIGAYLAREGSATAAQLRLLLRTERRQCARALKKFTEQGALRREGDRYFLPERETANR